MLSRLLTPSLAALCCSALLSAQGPCFAMNDGPAFNDGVSMGGPNLSIAILFRVPITDVVLGLEVFTGEAVGQNRLAIWSHDQNNNQPLAPLGGGSFQMSTANGWQGTCLDTPVPVSPQQPYWLVWDCVNSSQASVDSLNQPIGQSYRGSFDGGQSWNGPFASNTRHWKFRLQCATGTLPGSWNLEGTGCTGGNGQVPAMGFTSVPTVGGSADIQVTQAAPNSPAFLLLGVPTTTPVDLTNFGAPGCIIQCQIQASLGLTTDASGLSAISLPLAPLPSLVCVTFCSQWAVIDPAANQLGLAFSRVGSGRIGS